MTFICQRSKQHQGGLHRTRQADSGDFRIHKLEKIDGGEGKRKYPARPSKVCAAYKKRSETRYICKFCIVPVHKGSCFEKYHSVTSY